MGTLQSSQQKSPEIVVLFYFAAVVASEGILCN